MSLHLFPVMYIIFCSMSFPQHYIETISCFWPAGEQFYRYFISLALFSALFVALINMGAKSLSRVWLLAALWTVAHQGALSMGFSRQEYWTGLPCPPSEDLPHPGIEFKVSKVTALQSDSLLLAPPGKPFSIAYTLSKLRQNLVLLFLIFSLNIRIINKYEGFSLSPILHKTYYFVFIK